MRAAVFGVVSCPLSFISTCRFRVPRCAGPERVPSLPRLTPLGAVCPAVKLEIVKGERLLRLAAHITAATCCATTVTISGPYHIILLSYTTCNTRAHRVDHALLRKPSFKSFQE